jgi:hypothetical protein
MKKLSQIFVFALCMMWIQPIQPVTRTSAGDGNWNSTVPNAPWPSGIVPSSTDDVIIRPGDNITVTANATINSISFGNSGGSGTTRTFTVNSGVVLTVTAGITLRNGAGSDYSATITGAGTINCATFNVGGTITPTTDCTTILTATISNLSISGNLNIYGLKNSSNENYSHFNLSSGSVNVVSAVVLDAQYGGSGVPSSATLTLATGSQNGTLLLGGGTPFSVPGAGDAIFTANGSSATVNYSGSSQEIRTTNYTNLTLSGSGTKTFASGTTGITGSLTVNAGISVNTVTNSSTINYNGSSNQNVAAIDYYNLTLSNSGTKYFGAGTVGVGGDLSVSGSAVVDATTYNDTVKYYGVNKTVRYGFVNKNVKLDNNTSVTAGANIPITKS